MKTHDLAPTSRGKYILNFALSYLNQGDRERAEKLIIEKQVTKLPPDALQRITILLADIYRKKGALKDAYRLYEAIINGKRLLEDNEIAMIYLHMGKISIKKYKYEKARGALNQCIALAEKKKDLKTLLITAVIVKGNSYYHEGRHRQAVSFYEDGLERGYSRDNSDYWEIRYRLALSYLEIDEDLKAEPLLNEIAEEGDPVMQQRVQMKLGMMGLEKQWKLLSLRPVEGE